MATNTKERTQRLALSAVFCALAFLTVFLPVPKVQFLSFDIKDTVIALASLLLGPSVAASLSVAVPLLEFITVGSTGPWGLLMDVLSSLAFSLTAALIYKYRKTLSGAVLSLLTAVLVQVAVMMLANLLITPLYTGAPRSAVVAMLLPLLLPFNAVKSVFNASLVMALYKPLAEILRRARLIGDGQGKGYRFGARSALVLLVSLAVVVATVLILFLVLGAEYGGGEA
ncbi:MAG: ECF transporter S component [Clostridia bacterium]|nr:ECF transporter S component [Clostridia bacterium]